jgi:uncharacterized protein (DUF2236 family)
VLGIKTRKQLMKQYEPMADYGFLGPDSVSWKVWSHPSAFVVGFVRAVTIEHFDPNLAAAVIQSGGVKYRPATRYGRTLRYFGLQLFGGAEQTCKAADVLVKVHSKAIGHDPVTGGTYDANDGDSQLWIHVTAWHSILKCYEMFGPGKLTEAEEAQFWAECREIAKLQTIDPDKVPGSREEVHAYFEEWRPRLAASEGAQDMIRFILQMSIAIPADSPRWLTAVATPFLAVARRAVISTYPQYMRDMAGIRQSRITDAIVRVPVKVVHTLLHHSDTLLGLVAKIVAPSAYEIAAPALLGIPPLSDKVWEVREAQAHFGFDIPSEAHHDVRARQQDRVFAKGEKPSDDGLIESQELIGSLGRNGLRAL